MVTATTTRPEVFFSFFMFTADLQPDNPAYTEVIARHMRELSSYGYDGFDLPIAPTSATDHRAEIQSYVNLRHRLEDLDLGEVRITTNVATTRRFDPTSPHREQRDAALSYHHHMGTGVMTREETDRLMAGTDPSSVHLCLDTGHAAFAGFDPLDLAKTYADRIGHVHLKDVRPEVVAMAHEQSLSFQQAIEAGVFTVPGDGSIDFVPILQALADSGYEGWLIVEAEQDPAKSVPLEYAFKARRYLREVLGW